MDSAEHLDHHAHEHEMPTEGAALTSVAISATLHCLTGCAIGEIAGMVIGTALGFSDFATIALAVGLAFLFGYALTSLPLLRAGLALAAVIPIALASDTLSIAVMEIVDNAIMLAVPGAMEAGIGSLLFWGSLSVALVIAGMVAVPVNRWLIARGRGHAVVHETGIHGGPSPRLIGAIAAVAAVFGTAVLVAEAVDDDPAHAGHDVAAASSTKEEEMDQHGTGSEPVDEVRGLAVSEAGFSLELQRSELLSGREAVLRFAIVAADGGPLQDFEVEHAKRLHLIVVRRDLTGFQHLHPTLAEDGTWSTPLTLPDAGSYRVFADFKTDGTNHTLAADLAVDGEVDWQELPLQSTETTTETGYEVGVEGAAAEAGEEAMLSFNVIKQGEPVQVEPYLGADGHLVALREGDLAYLHVHPLASSGEAAHGDHGDETSASPGAISFVTEFPTAGRYRLFLQFKHDGEVHTAAFTREVSG
jgi:hypothetical protein